MIGRPVVSSRLSETAASTSPRMPCSGLNSLTSLTPGARNRTSIVEAPPRVRPVWLVTSPTRLFRSGRNPSSTRTSIPHRTGRTARAVFGSEDGAGPGSARASADRGRPGDASTIAAAASVATSTRSAVGDARGRRDAAGWSG